MRDQEPLKQAVLNELHALYGVNSDGSTYTYAEGDQYDAVADALVKLFNDDVLQARVSTLKKLAAKPHGGEDKSQDYTDGYNEMRGKILFEVKRLSK